MVVWPRSRRSRSARHRVANWLLSASRRSTFGTGTRKLRRVVADQPLDLALLVGPADQAEVALEEAVAGQAQEGLGQLTLARADDPGDGDLAVVVADALGGTPPKNANARQ